MSNDKIKIVAECEIVEANLIGLSLSLCIMDILKRKVEERQVMMIVASTKFETLDQWKRVLEAYKRDYWYANPVEAEKIANRLMSSGKIVQPRLQSCEPPNIAHGKWAVITRI